MPINVVIADDHQMVLDGLKVVLELEPDMRVAGTCLSGEEAFRTVLATHPDVLITDLAMPGVDGLELIARLRAEKSSARIIVIAASLTDREVDEALRLGVDGVMLKMMASRLLVQCVRKVHAGGEWIEQQATSDLLKKYMRKSAAESHAATLLTAREIEVIRHVTTGRRNREIAERLCLSESTVKVHLHNVYEKLNLRGRMEVTIWARERGLC